MPSLPVLPNNSIVNVQYFGEVCNQTIITLFQYKFDGASNPLVDYTAYLNDLDTVLSGFGNLDTAFLGAMPDNYALHYRRIQPVYPTRLRFLDYPSAGGGTNGNTLYVANLACSIERFSVQGGRRGIGRVQLPLSESVCDAGVIDDATYLNLVGILATQMKQDLITTGTGTNGTWNPVLHNLANAQPLTEFINGTEVKTTARTMHRRTVGLGI